MSADPVTPTFVTRFLSKAYSTIGLNVINDAAQNAPAVRPAAAVLIIAMLGATALFLYQGNLPYLAVTVIAILVLGVLVLVVGAAVTQQNKGKAELFSWTIVIAFSIVIFVSVLVLTSAVLFQYPRPVGEMLAFSEPLLSLNNVTIAATLDQHSNLIIAAQGVPRQPYSIDIDLLAVASDAKLGSLHLVIPNEGDAEPSGALRPQEIVDKLKCVVSLKCGKKTMQTRTITTNVSKQ